MTDTAATARVDPPGYWVQAGGWAVLASALVAGIYAGIQVARIGGLKDAALIVLVTANTLFIYRFGIHIAPRIGAMFDEFPQARRDPQTAVNHLLGDRATALPAIVFSGFIAFAVWQIDPWRDVPELTVWLCMFLFVNNLIVGTVIVAIARFWQAVLRELPTLDLRVLNLNRAPMITLLRINSQIVMATALVTCLSILALVLSDYAIDPIILVFSLSALAMVVATYAVPILPLSDLLAAKKAEELDRIERLIDAHVRRLSHQPAREDLGGDVETLPSLGELVNARDLLLKVRTLPPGGQISVSAAAIVTFLSFMPTLIDYAMRKFF
ncbi:hypothetical protein [Roseobacter sinensis]|uniref:Uncharacterized protein n=1 Tax=Roseobacter sinensis TaxID=2931391 RepID=A0ABT3BDR5_9RHOB|nr:hypothetical protein [Roseobacter sp. WL0113]MCV3271717.1 hypothetical protein [Roseobacter sp. WL0113]